MNNRSFLDKKWPLQLRGFTGNEKLKEFKFTTELGNFLSQIFLEIEIMVY